MAQATDDFSALARRYWGMWGDALRDAGAAAGLDAGTQGFRDALDAWRTQAGGQPGLGSLLDHVARQGKDWYAQMQQVALQFAGRDHSARDVAEGRRPGVRFEFRGSLRGTLKEELGAKVGIFGNRGARRLVGAIAAGALAFGLAACGGGTSPSTPTDA